MKQEQQKTSIALALMDITGAYMVTPKKDSVDRDYFEIRILKSDAEKLIAKTEGAK
jgi:CYTH domain-containing protein